MPKIKVKGQTVQTGECPQKTDTQAQTDGHLYYFILRFQNRL